MRHAKTNLVHASLKLLPWLACAAATSVTTFAYPASASGGSPPSIQGFVLYAQRSVKLGDGDLVGGGDVGVASATVTTFGPQLTIGSFSVVDPLRAVWSPSTTVYKDALVGEVETNTLTNDGGLIRAHSTFPTSSMPALPLALGATAGSTNVTVPKSHERTLAPGSYGSLEVNGTLVLEPGTFSFSSVTLGDHAQLLANPSGVDLRISGTLTTGTGAVLAPREPCGANHFTISVSGSDGPGGTSFAATLAEATLVTALVAVPHGTLSLSEGVIARGSFSAFDIAVGDHAAVNFDGGFASTAAGQKGSQLLQGDLDPATTTATVIGPAPGDTMIHLAFRLELQDANGLALFAQQVSTPGTPQYGQFLPLDELTARYSPSPANYQALVNWAEANHLTVGTSYPHRLLLDVSGPATAVEQALYVNLNEALRPDGSQFYEADREPSLDLTPRVTHLDGLDNFFVPRVLGTGCTSGAPEVLSADIRQAYVPCTSLAGTGQTVGVLAYSGYLHSDVFQYQNDSTLPQSDVSCGQVGMGPCLNDVPVNGFDTTNLVKGTSPSTDYYLEATADVELAIAMAPGLGQVAVFEASADDGCTGGADSLSAMLANPGIKQFSSSVSFCTSDAATTIQMMTGLGQAFFASSGDAGGTTPPAQPTGNSYVDVMLTSVGGTVLTCQPAMPEEAWLYSGGGVEGFSGACSDSGNCLPPWQNGLGTTFGVANGASATYRNEPDVSIVAENLYFVLGGEGNPFCGTSASAPLWAGFWALVNQQVADNNAVNSQLMASAGFASPVLYEIAENSTTYASSFYDVTERASSSICQGFSGLSLPPGIGYDLSTGWGTPQCALIDQVSCVTCNGSLPMPGPAPSVRTNGDCVAFQSDPNHCGSCGHSCSGGKCVLGQCQAGASILATASNVRGIVLDPSFLYWTDGVNATRVSKSGGSSDVIGLGINQAQTPSPTGPAAIAVDSFGLYWVSPTSTGCEPSLPCRFGDIDRVQLDGTGAQVWVPATVPTSFPSPEPPPAPSNDYVGGLVSSGSALFWASDGAIWQYSPGIVGPGESSFLGIVGVIPGADSSEFGGTTALDMRNLYWGSSDPLFETPLVTTGPAAGLVSGTCGATCPGGTTVEMAAESFSTIAVNSTSVYTSVLGGPIQIVPIDPSGAPYTPSILAPTDNTTFPSAFVYKFTVDETNAYIIGTLSTDGGNTFVSGVFEVPLNNAGAPILIGPTPGQPEFIANDDSWIYGVDIDPNSTPATPLYDIYRIAK